jgi:hypothetical protein
VLHWLPGQPSEPNSCSLQNKQNKFVPFPQNSSQQHLIFQIRVFAFLISRAWATNKLISICASIFFFVVAERRSLSLIHYIQYNKFADAILFMTNLKKYVSIWLSLTICDNWKSLRYDLLAMDCGYSPTYIAGLLYIRLPSIRTKTVYTQERLRSIMAPLCPQWAAPDFHWTSFAQ